MINESGCDLVLRRSCTRLTKLRGPIHLTITRSPVVPIVVSRFDGRYDLL